ncbi:MAG: hypothetical protein HY595_00980 [Candidatus Omnitrophica bacterium]|nr:hypothetical protein [Candidatus Omnitrophota bacterium]
MGRLSHLLVVPGLLIMGCAGWSQWMPEFAQGYAPLIAVRPRAQVVWTNDPYSRYAILTSLLSRVIPPRWVSLHLVVERASCGLCTSGPVVYVDPDVFARYADQEVMFALSHELAHGALGHLDNLLSPAQPLVPVGGDAPLTQHSQPLEPIVSAHFSLMQERAADRQATAYVRALGYDGSELRRNYYRRVDDLDEPFRASWLARHPIDTDATPTIIRPLKRLAKAASRPPYQEEAEAPAAVPGRRFVARRQSPLAPSAPASVLPESFDVDLRISGHLVQMDETDDGWLQILVKDILSDRVPIVVTTGTKIRHGYRPITAEELREDSQVNVTYHFDALTDRRYASTIEIP